MTRDTGEAFARSAARLIAALAAGRARLAPDEAGIGRYLLTVEGEAAPRAIVSAETVRQMCREAWLTTRPDASLEPTAEGRAWLARRRTPDDPYRAQHLAMVEETVADAGRVTVVANESPLAWLARRRGSDGRPMLTPVQCAAGERLRADVERARMMPRVTSDWSGQPLAHGRSGHTRGCAAAVDTGLAARIRVDRAMEAVGGDLASLLIDVCCFLTGLADAEHARGWPRRSGKVVLQIALDRLAEHYGMAEVARGPDRARRIVNWGAENFRPSL